MKRFLLLLLLVVTFSACGDKTVTKIESTYDDGAQRNVRVYKVHRSEETCIKETEYYPNGQVKMEGGIENDRREGEWKSYFESGQLQSVGEFRNGLRTGAAIVYMENGNKMMEGFYNNGKHSGKWLYYNEMGDTIRQIEYAK